MALFSYATKITEVFTSSKEEEPPAEYVENDNTTNSGKLENKVCLVILDGWGLSEEKEGNAIRKAETPVMDKLLSENSIELMSHGEHVGLPEGLMGNSEVGHLNIGAGRCVQQDILRIDQALKDGEFETNKTLLAAIGRAKQGTGRLHLAGLVSDGGVHSHLDHLFELVNVAKNNKVPEVFLHFFADGRDTAPKSGADFLQKVVDFFKTEGYGKLATIIGRYYAMDRDRRWERTCKAYEAMIGGEGEECEDEAAVQFLEGCYKGKDTDEFLKPIIFGGDNRRIKKEDTIIFFNCRADRMRSLAEVIAFGNNKHFKTKYRHPEDVGIFTMTQYNTDFEFPILFPSPRYANVLAEWLSAHKVSQFHCAETEKYAHITYFFNGGREEQFQREKRCLVHSPKVETYDKQPEMSSAEIANNMLEYINHKKRPFLMCNLAAPDMVSHTGNHAAAVKAIEATDETIGWLLAACEQNGYILLVTADHGNAEKMKDEENEPHKAHTCSPVPFACSSMNYRFKKEIKMDRPPALCDVAPTILDIMGLPKPEEMTGVSLVERETSPKEDVEKDQKENESEDVRKEDGEIYPKKEDAEEKETKHVEIQTELKAADIPETVFEEEKKQEEAEYEEEKEEDIVGTDDQQVAENRKAKEKEMERDGETQEAKEMGTYPKQGKSVEKKEDKKAVVKNQEKGRNNEGIKAGNGNKASTPQQEDNEKEEKTIQVKNKGITGKDQGECRNSAKKQKKRDQITVEKPTKVEKYEDKDTSEPVKERKKEVILPEEKRKQYDEEKELEEEVERRNEECNPESSSSECEKGGAQEVTNMNYIEKKGTKSGEKEEAIEVKETKKNNEEDVQVTAAKGRSKQSG